ncbi:hypothetical protein [Citrobacter phage Ci1]|nr:hypothetical protein [Citrobacter phage Ci1]
MTSLFKEVFSKKIVDFVIDQMKEQDASGLLGYRKGLFSINLAHRCLAVYIATDPIAGVVEKISSSKFIKTRDELHQELTKFLETHRKLQGHKAVKTTIWIFPL